MELFSILQAMKVLWEKWESRAEYTIFSDSTAAIEWVLTDRTGPGQALTRAVTELERLLIDRGCTAGPRLTGE